MVIRATTKTVFCSMGIVGQHFIKQPGIAVLNEEIIRDS